MYFISQKIFVIYFIHLEAHLEMFFITTVSLHISLRNFHCTVLGRYNMHNHKLNFNESTEIVYDHSTWAKDEILLIISFIDFFQMHTT